MRSCRAFLLLSGFIDCTDAFLSLLLFLDKTYLLSFWLDPKGRKRSRLVKRLFLLRKKISRPAHAGKPGDLLVPRRSFRACDPSFATAGKPPFHEAGMAVL
jgi:hypothetical protein